MTVSIADDFRESLKRYRFWLVFGLSDATSSFNRTALGGLFITLNTLLRVLLLYFLFRDSIGQSEPKYFGYVSLGLPLFSLYSSAITQGYSILTRNKSLIQNIEMPFFAYIFRFITDLIFKFCFSSIPFAVYIIFNFETSGIPLLLLFVGLVVAFFMVLSIAVFCMTIAAFFPNLFEALSAAMGIMFFATPVFWHAGDRGGIRGLLASYNPFSHMLAIVREPALGREYDPLSLAICVAITLLVGTAATYLFRIARPWLIYRL